MHCKYPIHAFYSTTVVVALGQPDEPADDVTTLPSVRSVYDFFGNSTILVESLKAHSMRTPHMTVELGVPGCGKSTFLTQFVVEVNLGNFVNNTGTTQEFREQYGKVSASCWRLKTTILGSQNEACEEPYRYQLEALLHLKRPMLLCRPRPHQMVALVGACHRIMLASDLSCGYRTHV